MTDAVTIGSDDALCLYAIVPKPGPGVPMTAVADGIELIEGTQFAAIVGRGAGLSFVGRDRAELARMLLAHQQLVERVMTALPVLPVKFATIAPDRASVERCLENGATAFADAFAALRGKTQFEILVTWDLDAVFAQIALDPRVVDFKQALASKTDGAPSKEAGVQLGTLVKQIFERRRADLGRSLSKELSAVAVDCVHNALLDDRMVLNLALLIDAEAVDVLDTCLETLDAANDGRLAFRRIGPLPPYSFANVEVCFLQAGDIARARELLALETVDDAETLRFAYRRRVKQVHPDSASDGGGGEHMGDLKCAYETLSSYVEAGGPVIVSVRRQQSPVAGCPT